jgi:hypothetical protein
MIMSILILWRRCGSFLSALRLDHAAINDGPALPVPSPRVTISPVMPPQVLCRVAKQGGRNRAIRHKSGSLLDHIFGQLPPAAKRRLVNCLVATIVPGLNFTNLEYKTTILPISGGEFYRVATR